MSISIQGSASAQLAALEALTNQTGGATAAGATPRLSALAQQPSDSSSIVDMSSTASPFGGASASLASSASIADAAVAGGATIENLLARMRQDAQSASDPSLDTASRASLNTDFRASLAQIQKTVASASVDGVNLIDGSVNGDAGTSAATLTGVNLSVGGPLVGLSADANLSDPAAASTIAGQLDDAMGKVGQALSQIASQSQAIETHLSLVAQAGLSLSSGVSGQVNANLDGDGARLAALQVQQQLSLSSSAVGNQSPNSVLALFQAA